jgi:PucR family transcriptional regulator, purine catabolism regulatory protein
MSMTVVDLVDLAHLGLTVRAGASGLNRRVTWAHVSELPNPAAWLEEGELLLTTGIGVPDEPGAQVAYLGALAERRIAAIGIGRDGRAPRLSDAMLSEAERQGLPVLEIPRELPFSAITRVVAAANEQTTHRRMLAYLRIFETLRVAVSDNLTPAVLFERLRRVSGYDLFLQTPGGEPVFDGVPPFTLSIRSQLGSITSTIEGGYVIPVTVFGRVAAYLAALARKPDESGGGLIAVQHIGTIAAIEMVRLYEERLLDMLRRSRMLADMLEGPPPEAATIDALRAEGLEPPFVFAAVRFVDPALELSEEEIVHRLADRSIPHLLVRTRDALLALLPSEEEISHPFADRSMPQELARTRDALLVLLPAAAPYRTLPDVLGGASVGVSAQFAKPRSVGAARRQALLAVNRASDRPGALAEWDDQLAEMDVLLSVDPVTLRALVDRVLGPVFEYDRSRNTHLLDSLLAYFLYEGKLDKAACDLHIHKNTLSYRLRTIERLTGRKLGRLSDMYELCMAVRAFEFLDADGGSGFPSSEYDPPEPGGVAALAASAGSADPTRLGGPELVT